jgi:hypothetical protein
MKVIAPYSPELRELKAKAIIELDRPLLAKLLEVEGSEFLYCETFLSLLQATSFESNDLPIVESSELSAVLNQFTEGD